MEVSRLTIAQETISKLSSYPLSKKRKREIRFDGIKKLIDSGYAGQKFKVGDLIKAAGYRFDSTTNKSYNNGVAFVSGLIRKGVLVRHEGVGRRPSSYSYTNKSLHGRSARNKVVHVSVRNLMETRVKEDVTSRSSQEPKYNLDTQSDAVEESATKAQHSDTSYCLTLKLEKRGESYGNEILVDINLNRTSLGKIEETIAQLIKINR